MATFPVEILRIEELKRLTRKAQEERWTTANCTDIELPDHGVVDTLVDAIKRRVVESANAGNNHCFITLDWYQLANADDAADIVKKETGLLIAVSPATINNTRVTRITIEW